LRDARTCAAEAVHAAKLSWSFINHRGLSVVVSVQVVLREVKCGNVVLPRYS
jgi:hypothetical protein